MHWVIAVVMLLLKVLLSSGSILKFLLKKLCWMCRKVYGWLVSRFSIFCAVRDNWISNCWLLNCWIGCNCCKNVVNGWLKCCIWLMLYGWRYLLLVLLLPCWNIRKIRIVFMYWLGVGKISWYLELVNVVNIVKLYFCIDELGVLLCVVGMVYGVDVWLLVVCLFD